MRIYEDALLQHLLLAHTRWYFFFFLDQFKVYLIFFSITVLPPYTLTLYVLFSHYYASRKQLDVPFRFYWPEDIQSHFWPRKYPKWIIKVKRPLTNGKHR